MLLHIWAVWLRNKLTISFSYRSKIMVVCFECLEFRTGCVIWNAKRERLWRLGGWLGSQRVDHGVDNGYGLLLLPAGASSCSACDAGKYSNATGQLPVRVNLWIAFRGWFRLRKIPKEGKSFLPQLPWLLSHYRLALPLFIRIKQTRMIFALRLALRLFSYSLQVLLPACSAMLDPSPLQPVLIAIACIVTIVCFACTLEHDPGQGWCSIRKWVHIRRRVNLNAMPCYEKIIMTVVTKLRRWFAVTLPNGRRSFRIDDSRKWHGNILLEIGPRTCGLIRDENIEKWISRGSNVCVKACLWFISQDGMGWYTCFQVFYTVLSFKTK